TAYDGETALRRHTEDSPDLVILDRKLPRLSGDEVCRRIRASSSTTPILMLTGERGADERAKLLDLGADDYLEKPFSRKELASRVRALLRRAGQSTARVQAAASVGRLRVDPRTHVASVDGIPSGSRRIWHDCARSSTPRARRRSPTCAESDTGWARRRSDRPRCAANPLPRRAPAARAPWRVRQLRTRGRPA